MYNLSKKQKIILGVIAVFIVCALSYYAYTKDENTFVSTEELQVENQLEEQEENKSKDRAEDKEFSDTMIMVHVSGAVNREGLIELKAKSRIADAIDKADGLREDACIDEINLAYQLEDGMKIHIPTKLEVQENQENTQNQVDVKSSNDKTSEYVSTSSGTNVENSKENQGTDKNVEAKININTATQTELETLPGIGPSTALKIINYRTENGKFKNIEEIKEVSGIGDSKYNNIKDLICI